MGATLSVVSFFLRGRVGVLDQKLDFRKVFFWIAAENHAGAFEVDFAGRGLYFVAMVGAMFEHPFIRAAELLIGAAMDERDAAAAGEFAN